MQKDINQCKGGPGFYVIVSSDLPQPWLWLRYEMIPPSLYMEGLLCITKLIDRVLKIRSRGTLNQ